MSTHKGKILITSDDIPLFVDSKIVDAESFEWLSLPFINGLRRNTHSAFKLTMSRQHTQMNGQAHKAVKLYSSGLSAITRNRRAFTFTLRARKSFYASELCFWNGRALMNGSKGSALRFRVRVLDKSGATVLDTGFITTSRESLQSFKFPPCEVGRIIIKSNRNQPHSGICGFNIKSNLGL